MKLKKIIYAVFLSGFSAFSLFGEEISDDSSEKKGGLSSKPDLEITRKVYPKPKHPPGYYSGILLISFSRGNLFSPTGSFISHEKSYDKNIKYGIESGVYKNPLSGYGVPEYFFQPKYSPLLTMQFDIEYGVNNYFGVGFSNFRYKIQSERQDIIYGSDKFGQIFYEPFPMKKLLFQGNAFLFMGTFHPFPKKILDPYIVLKAGALKFSGNAHSGLQYEPYITSSTVSNGLGKIGSGGIGMNFFISPVAGIKLEGSVTRALLNSDQMSGRILNTYNVQMGIFFNYSAIAAKVAYENQQ
ncbi:MAG: hypothetical protein OEZ34_12395 [Spirochaetia bacterium]|nr:hypothetical protein [Spirochaetia bacterium]